MNGVALQKFKPGTIVLQYENDRDSFLGVVVGDHTACRLGPDAKEYFEERKDHPEHAVHVCLVLMWEGFQPFDPYFDRPRPQPFPWYAVGRIPSAEEIDLAPEIGLMQAQLKSQSPQLNQGGSLRKRLFGFSQRRKAGLTLVQLVEWHLSGKGKLLSETSLELGSVEREKFLEELNFAFPLK